jgi:membrane fusion protein (multidrug efflux system)
MNINIFDFIFKKSFMLFNSTRFSAFLLIVFLSFAIDSCKSKRAKTMQKDDPPVVVDVLVASLQKIDNTIEANGTVIANENVDIHPEISGRLTYLNIPEGKYVTKGTLLARVNSADLEAQYQKSKVQLELQQTTEERLKKLLAVNGINQSDYDAALNAVNSTKADMDYTQTLIDKTVIRAPFGGTLGLRQVSPGAYVSPTTVLVTLQQLGTLKVDFTIPEEYGNLIKVGAKVDIEVDAANEITQSATIVAVEPQVNDQTRNLLVRAILSGSKSNPGAFVKVYVGSRDAGKMAVMVPTNAIIPNDINNQLVVIKDGKSKFVNITTGVRSANNVEITKGVNAGDTVVVTGVLFAKPGAEVHVRNVRSLAEIDKEQ